MLYELTLPAEGAMNAVARSAAAEWIGDSTREDDVRLIVSEYFTNAILHSRSGRAGHVTMRVHVDDDTARIEIHDAGALPATERRGTPTEPLSEFGRGLQLVDGIAEKWGHETLPDHQVWWAELTLTSDDPTQENP